MLKKLTDGNKAFLFYGIALALAAAYASTSGAITFVYAFTPLVAVAIMLFVVTRDGYTKAGWKSLGLHRLGLRAWPAALLVPLLVLGFAYGVLWSTGIADFRMTEELGGVHVPPWLLPLVVVWLIVQASLTTSLGEELGWRGYLLPRLESLGPWKASLLSGLLHGIWHLPFILLATGYHDDGNKLVVIPLFLVSLTIAGMFFGYLRLRTNSVWPAVIAHSAHNTLWAVFGIFTVASSPLVTEYLAGDSGILISVGYAVLAGWLMYTLTRRPRPVRLQIAESA